MDFTHSKFVEMINTLKRKGYFFYTFESYITSNCHAKPYVIIRHDVDRMPNNALKLAKLENELNVVSTYFFRSKTVSSKLDLIKQIKQFGHEIGYHYEELSDAKGNHKLAWELFKNNVKKLENISEIKSIAMHGRPFSKWNNCDLWNEFNYKDLGIKVEAYRDIPQNDYIYFTDTGRNWGNKNNRRDRIASYEYDAMESKIKTTDDIIDFLNSCNKNIILSIHPERWAEEWVGWVLYFFIDSTVNFAKKILR